MRGSLRKTLAYLSIHRIIPAHAGLTSSPCGWHGIAGDHPRACGAHLSTLFVLSSSIGSSPRMRGSHELGLFIDILAGIIPAHAGLTAGRRIDANCRRDHPRACGAHASLFFKKFFGLGSSPRMRGSQLSCPTSLKSFGIIPAHAGLTCLRRCQRCSARDHPRACGAH